MAVVSMVNKGTSKHKVAAHLLRCLALVTARAQISLSACHLPGADNCAADALSRGELPRFNSLVGDAEPIPTFVSDKLFVGVNARLANSAMVGSIFFSCLNISV